MSKETYGDQTTVRIPKELAQRVRALAVKKQSTVTKQAVYLIEKALSTETGSHVPDLIKLGNMVEKPAEYIYCDKCEMDVRKPHGHVL